MLLNRPVYLIRTRFDPEAAVDTYEILEPEAGSRVGYARERKPSSARQLVRSAFGRNLLLTSVHVYEGDDQNLVFSLNELPSLWRPHLVLSDASLNRLCYFRGVFASMGGGFVVRDACKRVIGSVYSKTHEGHYVFETRNGQTVGAIKDLFLLDNELAIESPDGYLVAVANVNDCGSVASMLLLGAAIAFDIVYRDRVGGDEVAIKNPPSICDRLQCRCA